MVGRFQASVRRSVVHETGSGSLSAKVAVHDVLGSGTRPFVERGRAECPQEYLCSFSGLGPFPKGIEVVSSATRSAEKRLSFVRVPLWQYEGWCEPSGVVGRPSAQLLTKSAQADHAGHRQTGRVGEAQDQALHSRADSFRFCPTIQP